MAAAAAGFIDSALVLNTIMKSKTFIYWWVTIKSCMSSYMM